MEPPVRSGSSENKSCIICKKNNDDEPGLKVYKSQTAVRNAAEKRCSLSLISLKQQRKIFCHLICPVSYIIIHDATVSIAQ